MLRYGCLNIFVIVLFAFTVSCSVIGKHKRSTYSLDTVESIGLGSTVEEVISLLGYADEAILIQTDKDTLQWKYRVPSSDVKNIHSVTVEFSGTPKVVTAKSCILNQNNEISKVEKLQNYFSHIMFSRIDEPWCKGRHYGPNEAVYFNSKAGIRCTLNKTRNDVGRIAWSKMNNRRPAKVKDFYSCDKPKFAKVTKISPRKINFN